MHLRETVNGRLLDRSIRHAMALHRYGNHLTHEVVGFLNSEVFPDLLGRLQSRLERIRLRGFDSGVLTTKRYAALLDDVAAIVDDGSATLRTKLVDAARELAKVEAGWQHNAIAATLPEAVLPRIGSGPDMRMVGTFLAQDLPHLGGPVRVVLNRIDADTVGRIRKAVGIGLAQGETTDDIVRRVRGTKANRYEDGALQTTRRHAETLTRTLVNHTSSQAREETFRSMPAVVKRVQWVSTLDTRTSDTCKALDGQTWPVGEGPRPPAHPNCRSTVVPVVASLREILGKTPKDVPEGTRASMNGQVSDRLTYGDWLAQQPREIQVEALGAARARLFAAGKIDVQDLTTDAGRRLTLEELQQR